MQSLPAYPIGRHTERHVSDLLQNQYISKAEYLANRARLDGFSEEKEGSFRKSCSVFLKKLCQELKLNQWVQNAAITFVERFFARRSYTNNDRFLVTGAALFMACKACDNPRAIRHVAYHYSRLKNASKKDGTAPPQPVDKKAADAELEHLEAGLMLAERALLYTLNFDIRTFNIVPALNDYLRMLGVYTLSSPDQESTGPNHLSSEVSAQFSSVAARFAQDIFKTTLMVHLPAEKIAMGCVHLAAEKMGIELRPVSDDALNTLAEGSGCFSGWQRLTDEEYNLLKSDLSALYKTADQPKGSEQVKVADQGTQSQPIQPESVQSVSAPAPSDIPSTGPSTSQQRVSNTCSNAQAAPSANGFTHSSLKPNGHSMANPHHSTQQQTRNLSAPTASHQTPASTSRPANMFVMPKPPPPANFSRFAPQHSPVFPSSQQTMHIATSGPASNSDTQEDVSPTDPQQRAFMDHQNNNNNTPGFTPDNRLAGWSSANANVRNSSVSLTTHMSASRSLEDGELPTSKTNSGAASSGRTCSQGNVGFSAADAHVRGSSPSTNHGACHVQNTVSRKRSRDMDVTDTEGASPEKAVRVA